MPTLNTDPGFSGISGSDIGSSAFNSMLSSFSSQFKATQAVAGSATDSAIYTAGGIATETSLVRSTTDSVNNAGLTRPTRTPNPLDTSTGVSSNVPTTFSTVVSPTATGTLGGATGTATNAASSSGAAEVSKQESCNSISCSSALKAAVAVPIVVAVLALAAFLVFFVRRRRRNAGNSTTAAAAIGSEEKKKKPKRRPGKNWSRHLRVFSFDTEVLMGGRFSSTTSIRSHPSVRSNDDTSIRSGHHSVRSNQPSLQPVEEEVAPPYHDVTSGSGALHHRLDPISRPSSAATAPPPYGSIAGTAALNEPRTPVSNHNPFADSAPVSPIEGSPFNDPPEEEGTRTPTQRPVLSRTPSGYHSLAGDDVSTLHGSEIGSIREAQLGRNVSVSSGGRTIDTPRSP